MIISKETYHFLLLSNNSRKDLGFYNYLINKSNIFFYFN